MSSQREVSVIIPTTGLGDRQDLLWRAIESVLDQEEVDALPLVVLNGGAADPNLEDALISDPRLRLIRLAEPDLPGSLLAGREAVETLWFAELDDDDFLLPGALALRVRALCENPLAEVVVTNGFRREAGRDLLHVEDMQEVARDPLRAMVRKNWLLPGSWLARAKSVGVDLFRNIAPYRECTYLAIQFVTKCQTVFLPDPTVVWDSDAPGSATKSLDYVLGGSTALRRILELDLPRDVRAEYRRRISQSHHDAARWYWTHGQKGKAWMKHFISLTSPGGWRYLRFTGRLFLPPPRA